MQSLLKGIQLANTKKEPQKIKRQKKDKGPIQTEVSYNDISKIVEYLVKTKSRNYTFDCWVEDDIAQEIRIICFKALKHFDVKRVKKDKWQNFFGRCVDNGLKNLKRDNYLRPDTPCKDGCGFLHGDDAENSKELGRVCKRWLRFKRNLKRKIKILHPIPIEIIGDSVRDYNAEEGLECRDLQEHLMSRMPERLRAPLLQMLTGKDKEVSRKDKQKIRDCVERILE